MNKEHMLSEVLCLPPTAIEYHLGQQLAKTFHDKALIEGDAGLFDVEVYADYVGAEGGDAYSEVARGYVEVPPPSSAA